MPKFSKNDTPYTMRVINQFVKRTVRTTRRAMSICVYGVKLWNSSEATLTNVHNDKSFKCKCKNMLLSAYIV